MFSKFKPINDYVLLELCRKQEMTKGGIFVPTESQEESQTALVIHAGKSKQCKAGNKVYFKKHIGEMLNDKLMVIKEDFILGVL